MAYPMDNLCYNQAETKMLHVMIGHYTDLVSEIPFLGSLLELVTVNVQFNQGTFA